MGVCVFETGAHIAIAGSMTSRKCPGAADITLLDHSAMMILDGTLSDFDPLELERLQRIILAYEKIIGHLEAWNSQQEIEMEMYRMPAPEFDKRALREAVVNAFCHRDYSVMGRIRVAVEDEGLTIANPGGVIEGVTIIYHKIKDRHPKARLLIEMAVFYA